MSSIIDLIIVKIMRIKHIEDNSKNLICSENVDSNYRDIINYAVFSMIKIDEERS